MTGDQAPASVSPSVRMAAELGACSLSGECWVGNGRAVAVSSEAIDPWTPLAGALTRDAADALSQRP
jgi:hypothetical protein